MRNANNIWTAKELANLRIKTSVRAGAASKCEEDKK